MKDSLLPPPHTSFSPLEFPFLLLVLKSGTRFPIFCVEYELRNVFPEIFEEFELEKLRKTRSEIFVQG
jgi:hypothetical protein